MPFEKKEKKPAAKKPAVKSVIMKCDCTCKNDIVKICEDLMEVYERLAKLEAGSVVKPAPLSSINKIETFNGDVETTPYEERAMAMKFDDKIQSMRNAIAILPPNMVKEGRHDKANVQAICGFIVTDEMMDMAYEGIIHED